MTSNRFKVYLAGKISKNDWRHDAVAGLRGELAEPGELWPTLPGAVLNGRADYVGPFFVGCDHGCTHSTGTHATFGGCIEGAWQHVFDKVNAREGTLGECLRAIEAADIVFAWVDAPDCYGTLVEIGYAAAKNKVVYLGFDNNKLTKDQIDDFWFAQHLSSNDGPMVFKHHTPADALAAAIPHPVPAAKVESEAERRFWNSYVKLRPAALEGLVSQHKVDRYRLDFAIPQQRIGFEIDGYAFHSDKETFTRDRKRQRELELAGWRIVRFSGKEACAAPDQCVRDAAAAVATFSAGPDGAA